jgi:hypothetical protein
LIQVVFGNQEVTKHNMVFSEKMLLAMVSKEFPNVKIIDDFEYLVAKINWQTICQATK